MKRPIRCCLGGLAAALLLLGAGAATAKIRVVASITDLGSIASAIGGDQVEVLSVARPNADVHHVEVLPSYMVRVSKAQIYLKVGLGLDQWADQIIDGSRNDHLLVVDCSRDIDALEKPTGKVDASMGDVHPNGNPHYWLDPRNGGVVGREIAEALGRLDPAHTADYQTRADSYAKEAGSALDQARQPVAALPVRVMITYHASWIYLAQALGMEIAGTVEPVPGIPPTGRHLQDLVQVIKERHIPVLLQEPYFSDEAPQFLARETGVRVIKISPSCDTVEAGSYLDHIRQIADAISRTNVGMIPN
jgi:ABC-type Zn uptake system ZnuABC Zn-binding protein ZnuA